MKNNRGVALLLTIIILTYVALFVIALLDLATTDLQIASNHLKKTQLLYTADAGLEYGVSVLRSSPGGFSQGLEFPSGSGNTYNVTYTSASGRMISIGTLASGEQMSLEAGVSVRGASSPYQVKILSWREV